ncbi:hypothetical protein C8Q74DRAFT_1368323 [Fomes fomentarius]|nr:hypothetical protein C8Q74DRAFT_1368323 [Fomes fomentarius]
MLRERFQEEIRIDIVWASTVTLCNVALLFGQPDSLSPFRPTTEVSETTSACPTSLSSSKNLSITRIGTSSTVIQRTCLDSDYLAGITSEVGAVMRSLGTLPADTGRLPTYRNSHNRRYHPYPRSLPRPDPDRLTIAVDPQGRLEFAFEPPSLATGCEELPDRDESPYDHDLPLVGDDTFEQTHNVFGTTGVQPTRATAKVAAAFTNMMFKFRRRCRALLAVADFLRRRRAAAALGQ